MLRPDDFQPPGPGSWTFDASHVDRPTVPLVQHHYAAGYNEGFRAAFAEVGSLLERIEIGFCANWAYMCVRPYGAPPDAQGSPPWLIFKLLNTFHPELRRRNRLAAGVFEARPWRAARARWAAQEDRFRAQLLAIQDRDPATRGEAGLVDDLEEALGIVEGLFVAHFQQAIPNAIPLGDLIVTAGDHGIRPAEVMRVLAGASDETGRPARMQRRIRAAIDAAGIAGWLDADAPEEALARLSGHATVGPPLHAYLREYGHRALDVAIEVAGTLVERPDLIVASLRDLPDAPPSDASARGLAAAAALKARLPPSLGGWWDAAVAEARAAQQYRETTVGFLSWAFGSIRRSAVALGAATGLGDAIFFVRADELRARPTAAELDRRRTFHEQAAQSTPPRHVGLPPSDPPPASWLPPGQARLTRAVMAVTSRFDADVDLEPSAEGGLRGLGVSPGTVEGRVYRLTDIADLHSVPRGCILVVRTSNPSLNPVLTHIAGLLTEVGGLVCHAAIMARELGFPGVVGCPGALDIPHGEWIRIDGGTGEVTRLGEAPERPALADAPPMPTPEPLSPRVGTRDGTWAPLDRARDRRRFGGKAANLATAIAAGHPVPPGVALDVDFAEAVAAGHPDHLARLAELLQTVEGPLAVRSSAPDEDGGTASFAGQHETLLGVSGFDAVVDAVTTVWRSCASPGVLAYRARMGREARPQMGVILQQMVPARAAGVRFGRDPRTGEDVRIVEAAPGLGAVVVDGRVRPDRIRLSRDGIELERTTGDKPIKLVCDGERTREVAVSADEAARDSLEPALVREVHALGEACDRLFDGAQDVEWAWTGEAIWLLQSRPVTTGAVR